MSSPPRSPRICVTATSGPADRGLGFCPMASAGIPRRSRAVGADGTRVLQRCRQCETNHSLVSRRASRGRAHSCAWLPARRDRRRRCCSSLSLCVFGQLVSFAQSGGACARWQQDQRASALAHPLQGPQEGLLCYSTTSGTLFVSHRGSYSEACRSMAGCGLPRCYRLRC
jgi:hypothetical protein